jgi:hypothetical protein
MTQPTHRPSSTRPHVTHRVDGRGHPSHGRRLHSVRARRAFGPFASAPVLFAFSYLCHVLQDDVGGTSQWMGQGGRVLIQRRLGAVILDPLDVGLHVH